MSERITTQAIFDPKTWTVTYVVWDLATRRAAVIDPVLDYDFKSGHTGTTSADQVLTCVAANALQVDWILETHAHADHLSGARYLQQRIGGRIAIGEKIREVQATFKKLYNLERSFLPDGSQFDHLFKDNETFMIGEVQATVMLVPGHTPADMAYLIDGSVFVGDTLFMPDVGSARARLSRRGRTPALCIDAPTAGPAARDHHVCLPRLPAGHATSSLADHRGRTEGAQHPR